jgi:hypothetical protein
MGWGTSRKVKGLCDDQYLPGLINCRYSNSDYIVFNTLLFVTVAVVLLAYDIACQWEINLPARRDTLPEHLAANKSNWKKRVRFLRTRMLQEEQRHFKPPRQPVLRVALPIWHGKGHGPDCESENSMGNQPGAGKTDAEGNERNWAELNTASYQTRVMSQGHRQDVLEDIMDHMNFTKNMRLCEYLLILDTMIDLLFR